jgi:Zn-finger nucleic acid-binding protein
MNCTNCGAPMRLIDDRDYFCCDYCSTFHFPEPLEASADGVTPLDQKSDVDCPVCQVPLSAGSIEGHRVLFCETCRGVLVRGENLMQIVRKRRAQRSGPGERPQPLNQEELKRHIHCPVCGRKMDVHPYYGPGNVVIDSCLRCHLTWLDHGEIAAIERAPGAR